MQFKRRTLTAAPCLDCFRGVAVLITQPAALNVPREEHLHHPHRSPLPVQLRSA